MPLNERERAFVAQRVAALERRTGTQVVAAVAEKSDSYPEAPWKAFALGTGVAAAACVAWQAYAGDWEDGFAGFGHVLVMLACGALLALMTVLSSGVARPFIDRARRDAEATQFAQALFFRRRLDRTRGRTGILLFVSLFERKVVLLADAGFDGRVEASQWQALAWRLSFMLRHGGTAVAMRTGLDALEALLLQCGFSGGDGVNELPDAVVDAREAT